jgi:NADH:ubiquinone oxidoreductase subunit 5 (subunit L)/multisubunit Na+/H+ antiporter MnhA subunit
MLRQILEHKWTTNIAAIIGALATIVVPIGVYYSQKADAAGTKTVTGQPWTRMEIFLLVMVCVFILIFFVSFIIALAHRKRFKEQASEAGNSIQESYQIIGILSALQGSYILMAHYITAEQHGKHSKESALTRGGTAEILTNSLKYDLIYAGAIAENLIKGAKYVYILPHTSSMIEELEDYISVISNSIENELKKTGVTVAHATLEELRSNNLEFRFFRNEIPCVYNFAIFHQKAEQESEPFKQYWWYINPSDKKPTQNSQMLSYEIAPKSEQAELDKVFRTLKESASKMSGEAVYDQRTKLAVADIIGGNR